MDAQELRNLQEAYREVVMGEEKKPLPVSKMSKQVRKKAFRAGRELAKPGVDKYDQAQQDIRQSMIMSRIGGEKVSSHADAGFKQGKKASRNQNRDRWSYYNRNKFNREQVDIYDIILSHLLDEGYAETPEAAEVIMVNMSEEWRDTIVYEVLDEGKVSWDNPRSPLESGLTPREKNRAKRKSIEDKESPRYKKLQAAQDAQKGTKVPANKRHKFETGYGGDTLGQERRLKGDHKHYMPGKERIKHYTTSLREPKESYDIYDIILSHLLDEGYAETPEAAEVIMVNMSEEWRDSIIG